MSNMITAIIPVRAGSRRLKNKNLALLAGETLLERKIRILKQVNQISSIIVSSNDDKMLSIAEECDAKTHRREDIYCDEVSTSFSDVIRNILSSFNSQHVLWATVTSPLLPPSTFEKAIEAYLGRASTDKDCSLISVVSYQKYLRHFNRAANYRTGRYHLPSQELSGYHELTNGIMISSYMSMMDKGYLYGEHPILLEVDKAESVDIDDVLDLAQATSWEKLISSGQYIPQPPRVFGEI